MLAGVGWEIMLEFTRPGAVLICDTEGCDEQMEWVDWIEFPDLLIEMKDAGWQSRKVGDEWTHTCPTCQHDSRMTK